MTKGLRLICFLSLAVMLMAIYFFWKGSIFPDDIIGILVFSALLMLSFNSLISMYFSLPSLRSFSRCSSNLSLANFRNISPRTTCLYSADSTLPLSLLADSQRVSSMLFCLLLFLPLYV